MSLKSWRDSLGYTCAWVAKAVCIAEPTLYWYEHNPGKAPPWLMKRLATLYRCKIEDLDGDPPPDGPLPTPEDIKAMLMEAKEKCPDKYDEAMRYLAFLAEREFIGYAKPREHVKKKRRS